MMNSPTAYFSRTCAALLPFGKYNGEMNNNVRIAIYRNPCSYFVFHWSVNLRSLRGQRQCLSATFVTFGSSHFHADLSYSESRSFRCSICSQNVVISVYQPRHSRKTVPSQVECANQFFVFRIVLFHSIYLQIP